METCTKADVVKYIALIRTGFDGAYKGADMDLLVEIWYDALKIYPKAVVSEALRRVIRTCKYTPKPADVCAEAEKLLSANEPSETDYWAEAEQALIRFCGKRHMFQWADMVYEDADGIHYFEEYRRERDALSEYWGRLSPVVKSYFVTVEGLMRLADECGEDGEYGYEKGRFLKLLPSLISRQKTLESLPPSLRDMISDTAEKLRLEKC